MKSKYSYEYSRVFLKLMAIIFFTQLILEGSGMIVRDEGMEWVLPANGIAFLIAVLYSLILLILNAYDKYQS